MDKLENVGNIYRLYSKNTEYKILSNVILTKNKTNVRFYIDK